MKYYLNSACPREACTGKLLEILSYPERLQCSHCRRFFNGQQA